MSDWISVKDRLPDFYKNSLVLFKPICGTCSHIKNEYHAGVGYLHKDNIWYGAFKDIELCEYERGMFNYDVTHWMPLPSIPMINCDE